MNKSEINITIGKDGNVSFEVQGVPGKDCLNVTKFLEEELGTVVQQQKTAEYYQEEVAEEVSVKVGED
ncbi:MAG: DUF2997 domain-containing protein [Bradymonadales bacterium]|nr:DUF2997 domain-containing protein [Bradymonadales bacterium]